MYVLTLGLLVELSMLFTCAPVGMVCHEGCKYSH